MRKIKIILITLLLTLLTVMGARHAYYPSAPAEGVGQGTVLMSSQIVWQVLDATTNAGDEPNDLGVAERTYLTVLAAAEGGDDEISYARIPPTWIELEFRCIGITDGGVVTYQIYFGTKGNESDCAIAKAGQLAFVIGTQVSTTATYEYADTLVVTPYCWTRSWGTASPVGNLVAGARIDVGGADWVVAVCTSANCNTKLLVKGR